MATWIGSRSEEEERAAMMAVVAEAAADIAAGGVKAVVVAVVRERTIVTVSGNTEFVLGTLEETIPEFLENFKDDLREQGYESRRKGNEN